MRVTAVTLYVANLLQNVTNDALIVRILVHLILESQTPGLE